MLKRFKKIANIGRFCDTDSSSKSFTENTILFGNNGNGKSTLTAILRSLQTNNPKLIKQRRTFGTTADQKVELVFGDETTNETVTYQNERWNNVSNVEPIYIFDNKYIAENIFDGERIVDEHRKNLHRVVVGEPGRVLAEKIASHGRNVREIDSELTAKKQLFSRSDYSRFFAIDDFIALTADPDIEAKIENVEKQIKLSKVPNKPLIPTSSFDFGTLREALDTNPESTHEDAKATVLKHIQEHWADESKRKEFLKDGLGLIKNGCPFCGQSLDSVSGLLDSYRDFFDGAYQLWETKVKGNCRAFTVWNLELEMARIEAIAKEWSALLPDGQEELLEWIENQKADLLKAKQNFDALCTQKASNVQLPVDFESIDLLEPAINKLVTLVEDANEKIKKYKLEVAGRSSQELESDLKRNQGVMERQSPQWTSFASEYAALKASRSEQNSLQEASMVELDTYSQQAFASHQRKINEILGSLGADFTIQNLAERTDRRRADSVFCGFDLEFFNSHAVSIDSTDDETPDFQTTLSQGDKNLLAFAFFISSLSNVPDLTNSIIVIDDPISSFDHERKWDTVKNLAKLKDGSGQAPGQIIILTHERGFLRSLHQDTLFSQAKFLKLINDGRNDQNCRQSKIDDCDPWQDYLKPQALKDLEKLQVVVNDNLPIPDGSLGKCRTVLENIFKTKYHLELKHLPKSASIGSYVSELKDCGVYTPAQFAEFEYITGKLHEPHHSQNSTTEDGSDGDTTAVIRETLRLARIV